jgi:hypothetical protein
MPRRPHIYATLATLWLAMAGFAAADTATNSFFARAEKNFLQAQQHYLANTNAATNALVFAQACFELADAATNETQRAEIARLGIAVCHHWLAREPAAAPGHYYLGMNLGQLAKAEAPSLAAYKLVHEVEREFQAAAKLDVHYDYAGPARLLGLLYLQAPGWPLSVGNKRKAGEWLERAAALAPDYPENQLCLAEAQLKWRQREELETTLKKIAALWPAARARFTGEKWEQNWQRWDARRATLTASYQWFYGGEP